MPASLGSNLNPYAASNEQLNSYAEPVVTHWAVALFTAQGFANVFLLGATDAGPFPLPEDFPYLASVVGLIGIPFVYVLPTIQAQGMARHWGVPKKTLLISRPILRFICSAVLGSAVGALIALPFVGLRFIPLAISYLANACSIVISTRRRFHRHRGLEWTMPPPGYKIMRPLIRGSRPDA